MPPYDFSVDGVTSLSADAHKVNKNVFLKKDVYFDNELG